LANEQCRRVEEGLRLQDFAAADSPAERFLDDEPPRLLLVAGLITPVGFEQAPDDLAARYDALSYIAVKEVCGRYFCKKSANLGTASGDTAE
jgi:hypothetical protein